MARSVQLGNQSFKKPGVYSETKFRTKSRPIKLDYGTLLIIDTGLGSKFAGGAGVAGENFQGKKSIVDLDTINDFQDVVAGGYFYALGKALFFPNGTGTQGVSGIEFLKAAETLAATFTFAPVGGGTNGGSLVIKTLDEGRGADTKEDETLSVGTIEVTNIGADGDTLPVEVDAGGIGTYTKAAAETTLTEVAAAIAVVINAFSDSTGFNSYTASSSGAFVTILAPIQTGVGGDALVLTAVPTGTLVVTVTTFAGGVDGTLLKEGYAVTMQAGIIDTAKFTLKFSKGTFRGIDIINDALNDPWDFIKKIDALAETLMTSVEFDNITDLHDWTQSNADFQLYFRVSSFAATGSGAVDAADLAANTGNLNFSGGKEIYSNAHLDTALNNLLDSQTRFILLDKYGVDTLHANNIKIQGWSFAQAKYPKSIYVAGGKDSNDWSGVGSSLTNASVTNDQRVSLVHGGNSQPVPGKPIFKDYDALYKAAQLLGREAGLPPQIPLTNKPISMSAELHSFSANEIDQGLDGGILMTNYDNEFEAFVCVDGINTLQNNDNDLNADGTTPSKQMRRIVDQLNMELVVNAKKNLFSGDAKANRNTLSPEDVKTWTETFLGLRIATPEEDNLIVLFQNIVVTVDGVAYSISYEIEPNTEVKFLLFTQVVIEA